MEEKKEGSQKKIPNAKDRRKVKGKDDRGWGIFSENFTKKKKTEVGKKKCLTIRRNR